MDFPPPTPKQARLMWLAVGALSVVIIVGAVAGAVWGLGWVLKLLSPVLWPLAIAGVIAYLLDPVVDFLERKKVTRQRAILLVFSAGLFVIAGFVASVVPQIVHEAGDLAAAVPGYSRQ